MSIEQAKALIDKMKTDDSFRSRIVAIEDLTQRMHVIQEEGFSCTIEEIQKVSAEIGSWGNISGGAWMENMEDIFLCPPKY
ncbi:MAG: Nif11-like leader peptide family natural product precursor [Chlorobiaceae bacterium]|jgi:predicted ribosomally synthesized peptide with nif11-like leader|nr:Nif11-like leader peptide family natural product precursor [Chlorobiaceae bacterium]